MYSPDAGRYVFDSEPFVYKDSQSLAVELSEFYFYNEEEEFRNNAKIYDDNAWTETSSDGKRLQVAQLLEIIQFHETSRVECLRMLLHLIQGGPFKDLSSRVQYPQRSLENILEFLTYDGLSLVCTILHKQFELWRNTSQNTETIANEISLILTILYTVVETIRSHAQYNPGICAIADAVKGQLGNPSETEPFLTYLLFEMIDSCLQDYMDKAYLPFYKISLLLWKVILLTLGGMDETFRLKNEFRQKVGLPLIEQDPAHIVAKLRAEEFCAESDADDNESKISEEEQGCNAVIATRHDDVVDDENISELLVALQKPAERQKGRQRTEMGLMWKTKVFKSDMDKFLRISCQRCLGIDMTEVPLTTNGLPNPVVISYKKMQEYLYTPLWYYQIEKHHEEIKYPLTGGKYTLVSKNTEFMYRSLLPNIQVYLTNLVELLNFASSGSPNMELHKKMMVDLTKYPDKGVNSRNFRLSFETPRFKVILAKAITSTILLLLKHLKINHLLQFEYVRCILETVMLVSVMMKFFDCDVSERSLSVPSTSLYLYEDFLFGSRYPLEKRVSELRADQGIQWTTLVTMINTARILNKLCKERPSMIITHLARAKNLSIIKRWITIPEPTLQYYCLKLVKMQSRCYGRQWRRQHMHLFKAIYRMIRHRYNDEWAFGNPVDCQQSDDRRQFDVRSSDIYPPESDIQSMIEQFHENRYRPDDSERGEEIEPLPIPDWFEDNMEQWLQEEVFQFRINWDVLIAELSTPLSLE